MQIPAAPLYCDPIYNGASDPTLIWNREERQWWMIYTQRRPTIPCEGVAWVHGSDLGVASSENGHNWRYRGTLEGLAIEPGRNTWWAPEVIWHDGTYHMYVSYIQGVPESWTGEASIRHYTSHDLWNWQYESKLELSSDRVIDACVAPLSSGGWRMWYKCERNNSYSYAVDSDNLYDWHEPRCVIDHAPHEGPNVFRLGGNWWLIADFWHGQGVFRGNPTLDKWSYRGLILDVPGRRKYDRNIAHHADVVVQGDEAYIFYFTHPRREIAHSGQDIANERFTAVQVARITSDGEKLFCDRNEDFDFKLLPGEE